MGGRIIHYVSLGVPIILILYTIPSFIRSGIYSGTYLFISRIHSFTLLMVSLSFLTHYRSLRFLYPLARSIITATMMAWYIYFGGLLWDLNSLIVRGHGFGWHIIPGLIVLTALLVLFDNKHSIFWVKIPAKTYYVTFFMVSFTIIAFVFLYYTGFWEAMTLSDMGMGGPDPNRSIFWLLMRLFSFWYLLPSIMPLKYSAPLKLDAGVLI